MTTDHKPRLTARETTKLNLLAAIAARPGRSKLDVITDDGTIRVPTKTRAGQYVMIDALIRRGLVENRATSGNTYELHATPAGEAEIAYWVANQ